MNRAGLVAGLCLAAGAAGIALGQLICHSIAFRDAIGAGFGRGHLLALTGGEGIYETDVEREIDELDFANGREDVDPADVDARRTVLARLIATAAAKHLAKREEISGAQIDRQFDLIRSQFRDRNAWIFALGENRLSHRSLRSDIADNLRAQKWIERQLGSETRVTENECAAFFNAHQALFALPPRFRASHLFLAAPFETPPPIVDLKRRTIDSISVRLSHGEDFSELIGLTSEDEATKTRGGDLGFFFASRTPPDFFSAIGKMQLGQVSAPIQTRLGFHVVRLTDSRPARQMNFGEAGGEIRLKLENDRRRETVQRLAAKLMEEARFVRVLP